MQCIFCFTDAPGTNEHVFQEAIGGSFSIRRVCKRCNDRLGSDVDPLLTDHPMALMHRHMFGLKGKSGTIPPLLRKGTINVESRFGERMVEAQNIVDPRTGVFRAQLIPKIFNDIGADGNGQISAVFSKETDARKWFANELRRRKMLPDTTAQLDALFDASIEVGTIKQQTVTYPLTIDLLGFRTPLIKIAYELGWHWLGDTWLQDPVAKRMRKVMRSHNTRGVLPIRGTIGVSGHSDFFDPLSSWLKVEPCEHCAMLIRVDQQVAIIVTVFNYFQECIQLSAAADKYSAADLRNGGGRVLLLNSQAGTWTEESLLDACNRRR